MRNLFDRPIRFGLLLFGFLSLFIVAQVSAAPYGAGKIKWQGAGIAPYKDAPLCPSHDKTRWHGIWDAERGCHYDHEHKDNPGIFYKGMSSAERNKAQALNAVFGEPGAWFGGTSISYPWQTFMGANSDYPAASPKNENAMKHEGYGWISEAWLPQSGNTWVRDYRVEYHAIFAAMGAVTRYHSFSLEANVCQENRGCHIVRTGGWLDFGHLIAGNRVVEIDGQEGDGVRRRIHTSYNAWYETDVELFGSPAFWYGRLTHPDQLAADWQWDGPQNPFDRLVIALETSDTWAYIDPDAPVENYFYCPAFDCNKNGSTIKLHRLDLFTRPDMLEFAGFTDRYGLVNESCTAVGLDCIPTLIEPPFQLWSQTVDNRPIREFDYSPEGTFWIDFPN